MQRMIIFALRIPTRKPNRWFKQNAQQAAPNNLDQGDQSHQIGLTKVVDAMKILAAWKATS